MNITYILHDIQHKYYSLTFLQVRENNEEASDDDEVPEITHWEAVGWLIFLTLWISVLSGYLVDAIQVTDLVTLLKKEREREREEGVEVGYTETNHTRNVATEVMKQFYVPVLI